MAVAVTSRASFVQETSTTTGTGTYSLAGATTGFQTFVAGNGDAEVVRYSVTDGTNWEVCEGTITDSAPDTLTRDQVLESSNAGSAVNWGGGTKTLSQIFSPEEAAQGKIEIQTITNVTAGTFNFTSIPAGYRRLILKGKIRSEAASGTGEDVSYLEMNGDNTVGNYHSEQNVSTNNGGPFSGEYAGIRMAIADDDAPTGAHAQVEWVIECYTDSNLKMVSASSKFFQSGTSHVVNSSVAGGHKTLTAAITQLEVVTDGADDMFGVLTLYGEY